MNIRRTLFTLIFISSLATFAKSQSGIKGHVLIDTSVWSPVVYLSLIDNFDQMNSMTNEMIIDKAQIDKTGNFSFSTLYLPQEDRLYRIHISRRSDPPASLTIGGKDENHVFFIANRKSDIILNDTSTENFLKDMTVNGYSPNKHFKEINEIASYSDSSGVITSAIKTDLLKNAVDEKLRIYADTSTNPLVSLYALYKTRFENNYPINQQFYTKYLRKWKNEKSGYFVEFRKKIPGTQNKSHLSGILIGGGGLITGFLLSLAFFRIFKKEQNPLHDLSVQERKIFALIMEGKSNKEISDGLMIGLSTVKSHVNSIYSKLGISSRKDALNFNIEKRANGA